MLKKKKKANPPSVETILKKKQYNQLSEEK